MASIKQIPGDLDITIRAGDILEPIGLDFDIDISSFTFVAEIVVTATAAVVPMVVDESQKADRKISISCLSKTIPKGKQKWELSWSAGVTVERAIVAGDYEVI